MEMLFILLASIAVMLFVEGQHSIMRHRLKVRVEAAARSQSRRKQRHD